MNKDYIKGIEGAERRFITPNIEFRNDDDSNTIQGVAAVVEKSTDLGWFEERISRGAFDNVLRDDVVALFNHDPNYPLARSNNGQGTLELFLTESGDLGYRYNTPDRTYAKDLQDAIRSGDVTKSSFAFKIKKEEWTYASDENGLEKDVRNITEVDRLYDVSPVTYPAYQDTSVAARSLNNIKDNKNEKEYLNDQYEFDQLLMNLGL